ncbi:MAG TPA: VWA domain-containing protein [Pyrinomonadaceae bacterium]|jgi:VWFA-related protein|nr:VWA domain-containing protein [Pyrinomonadaceae bacterium]
MKKSSLLALFLALVFGAPAVLRAQMRPRRTADAPAQTQPSKAPTPLPKSTGTAPKREATQEQTAEEVGEDEVVRINATLVTIPVSVLDRDGRFISGLRKEDFRIFEDGGEQQVAYFATTEEPFTVALVLDTSGSTRFKLEDIQDAAIAFLDQLRPDDKVVVISFDESVRVLSEATNDRRLLREAIRRTRTGGGTRLYDAVDLAIQQQLARARGRKAIVLFTDGVDTASHNASFESTLAEAEELDALIYPIQYDTYDGGGGGGTNNGPWPGHQGGVLGKIGKIILDGGNVNIGGGGGGGGAGTSRGDYRRAADYLRRLADATGGRLNNADDIRYLEDAFTNIAEELRRQYSLGYYPSRQSQANERRQIRVRVKRPNLVVRARDSYIYKPSAGAPADSTAQQPQTQSAPVLKKHDFSGGTRE